MQLILIVNPELGWDTVVASFDASTVSDTQYNKLEEICERDDYILIDWRSLTSVESFIQEHE